MSTLFENFKRTLRQPSYLKTLIFAAAVTPTNAYRVFGEEKAAGMKLLHTAATPAEADLIRQVLEPAGVRPPRRTTELTVAMLQLVASGRGVAALPLWAVQSYLDRGYVTARPIGSNGLRGELHAACLPSLSAKPYLQDFVQVTRETSLGLFLA